jgi:ATP-binding cassette subfamily B (MDR/TAP) protein 1
MNVLIAVLLGGFAIMQGAPNIQYVIKGRIAGARVFRLVERKPQIVINPTEDDLDGPKAGAKGDEKDPEAPEPFQLVEIPDHTVKGEIKLISIVFAYPARPDVQVFNGFSITIPASKTMALVGSSGSGKSTVVGLIERFYDPQGGCVMLDGVDIRSLKLSWLRNQVGLVSQEPVLFATSVRDNIAMGKPDATDAEIMASRTLPSSLSLHSLPLPSSIES